MRSVTISDATVERYFVDHEGEFDRPEEVHVAEMVLLDRARAAAAAVAAKEARKPDATADAGAFRDLVVRFSEDPHGKQRGGDLGYLRRDNRLQPPGIVHAAFALSSRGDIGEPIRVDGAYHVLKLLDRRDPVRRSVSEVAEQIRQKLLVEDRRRRLESLVKSTREGSAVTVSESRLDDLRGE
jgi:peptidyl-prolyl cis-trans isomerase D